MTINRRAYPIFAYLFAAFAVFIIFELSLTITQLRALFSKDLHLKEVASLSVKTIPLEEPENINPTYSPIHLGTDLVKGKHYGIHIIGERHTGSNWITDHLNKCFGHSISVKPRLTRFKHWFQYRNPSDHGKNFGVVVALVRNPYDWLSAMVELPHHSLAHWNLTSNKPLFWKDFVTRSWTIDRSKFANYLAGDDLLLIEKVLSGQMTEEELLNTPCEGHSSWRYNIPCSMNDRKASSGKTRVTKSHALYELQYNGSGLPYSSILELRREKILDFFQNVPRWDGVSLFIPLRYEDVVSHGSNALIENIQKVVGVKASCEPLKPQTLKRKKISQQFFQWLNENLDWETEAIVGYGRENFTGLLLDESS